MYGVPKHYPVASRAGINQATETATVEIKRHKDGIHIFLSKFDPTTSRTTGLATFKLIEGGDFNLEVSTHNLIKGPLSYH